jgi:ABC-2 type transport system permease protein
MMRRISIPQVRREFGFATHARQMVAVAGTAFGTIVKSAAGLVALAVALLLALLAPALIALKGVPLLPRTAHVLTVLTAPVADNPRLPWVLIPLLIVFYAGELVWRERDAGLGEITDALPVPEWALFLGKFLGLILVLVVLMALVAMAGMLGQMRMGYFDLEIGLYLRILFGLQLFDYILFALLVFVVHAVVNQKHVGYLVALIAYGVMIFPSFVGLEHHLLIYGSGPRWTYSDIRGFGPSLGPWLWFKLYWAAWAVLLAVAATLLWPRGPERSLWSRLQVARRRSTRATVGVAATAAALIVTLGGFIFYNTNLLNRYHTASEETERRAEYERRYGKYAGVAQPTLASTNLRVEIYPDLRKAEIRGTYVLANTSSAAINSVHVTTAPGGGTGAVSISMGSMGSTGAWPASPVLPMLPMLMDEDLGYRIYALEKPLQPGDSLQLSFEVQVAPQGFRNNGADAFVVQNGSHFTNRDWLPAIGYQRNRELDGVGVRRQYGLAPQPAAPLLDDPTLDDPSLDKNTARRIRVGGDPITFEAIVGTSTDQVAVAPGALRHTWTEGGRRYFHYVTDVPINNQYGVFSATYAQHEEQWTRPDQGQGATGSGQTVAIQTFHHPGHTANLGRMVASVRASLDHYTRQFGPYPYSYIRLIENPVRGIGVGTEAATVEYGEGFSLLNPGNGPQDLNIVFAVVAHGVARNWWGMQVAPADVEGARLLDVSLETYSAMRVVEETLGPEHLRRYLLSMREGFGPPRQRAAPPLLRATDSFSYSRRGPFALYALSQYIGKDQVDDALRSLLKKHGSGVPPLPTSLDLYRELQAVTPDSYQSLLRDLFEKNTFWELETERATAQRTTAGAWQVTLDVQARKVFVDEVGHETEVPMDDWLEVGVFDEGARYLQKHRIHSGKQTITVTVSQKPARAGIDPRHLLSDLGEIDKNVKQVD